MSLATSSQLSSILTSFSWSLSTANVVESLHYDRPGKHLKKIIVIFFQLLIWNLFNNIDDNQHRSQGANSVCSGFRQKGNNKLYFYTAGVMHFCSWWRPYCQPHGLVCHSMCLVNFMIFVCANLENRHCCCILQAWTWAH